MADNPNTIRPTPQRPASLTVTASSTPSTPSTPAEQSTATFVSRTRSVLNLTSSTLFGIYAPNDSDSNITPCPTPLPRQSVDEDKRPSITGAFEKPELRRTPSTYQSHESPGSLTWRLVGRTILLFGFGVAYGILISHLHDSQRLSPVRMQGVNRSSWAYLGGWGLVAVALGGLTPWVDIFWEDVLRVEKDAFKSNDRIGSDAKFQEDDEAPGASPTALGADWNPVVRSIGAFVGIAFAIRKLAWESTLQVSLTLALVNPVLWYLIDRSKPGLLLSTIVGLAGTAIIFSVNPDLVPLPAAPSPRAGTSSSLGSGNAQGRLLGLMSKETLGVATWVASVLFCSSVCFGSIGRRLALRTRERRGSVEHNRIVI